MRDLLSLRSAVEYLINAATNPKELTQWNPVILFYTASLVYGAAANSVMAKRT